MGPDYFPEAKLQLLVYTIIRGIFAIKTVCVLIVDLQKRIFAGIFKILYLIIKNTSRQQERGSDMN